MFGKNFFAVFFFLALASFSIAQTSSDVALELSADTFYVKPGETFSLTFSMQNFLPAGDNVIDRIDVYFLDLENAGLEVQSFQGESWQHEFLERFGDDQFFASNVTSAPLTVVLKASADFQGATVNGFYSFEKRSGTPALKLPTDFSLTVNAVPLGQAIVPSPTKQALTPGERARDNTIMLLSIVVAILAAALVFAIAKSRRLSVSKAAKKR